MKTKATNPALSIIGWIALALVDIVLAGLLFFGLLYFFIYPYDLPLNNRSLRETPGLAEGTLVDVTATNAHFRQPINSPLEFFKINSSGAEHNQEYALYQDDTGTLYVAPIEVCPFFARYRAAFDAQQAVPGGDEVSLEFGKPIIRFDTVTVRNGSHVVVTDAEGSIIDWRLCGLAAIGLVTIALLAIEYRVARYVQSRRCKAKARID